MEEVATTILSGHHCLLGEGCTPATQPSCPVFVGRNFDRLLVTTASEGMDEHAKAADPQHGMTFILDVGATGRPEPRVRLTR